MKKHLALACFIRFPISFSFILLLVCFSIDAQANEASQNTFVEKLFLELWTDNSYHHTQFGADEPDYTETDYYISQTSLTTGVRLYLDENFYIDPRLTFELSADGGGEEWNDVYWNNMMVWGVGARLGYENTPEYENEELLMVTDFTVEMTADFLFSENSPDGAKEKIPETEETDNFITGVSVWTSLETKELIENVMSLWVDVGLGFTYESTGFAEEGMDNFFLFTIDSKVGPQFPIGKVWLQPYYFADVIRDLGGEAWNKEPWLNNVTYGPGIRLALEELLPVPDAELFLYGEYLQIDYFSRVDAESYECAADDDFRVGIEIYLPFGAVQSE